MGQRDRTYETQNLKPFINHELNLVISASSPNWVFGPKIVLKRTLSPREDVGRNLVHKVKNQSIMHWLMKTTSFNITPPRSGIGPGSSLEYRSSLTSLAHGEVNPNHASMFLERYVLSVNYWLGAQLKFINFCSTFFD